MEREIAEKSGIEFVGFPAEPLWSLRTSRGWRSLAKLIQSRRSAKQWLRANHVDAVFSTGGYAAGPVMGAARSLGIPYVVHEANSIPGRANRMFAPNAKAFTSVFRATAKVIPMTIRTGQPIRRELREAARSSSMAARNGILVVGGSQGAQAINEAILGLKTEVSITLVAGAKNFDVLKSRASHLDLRAFLAVDEMAAAYQSAELVVGRSGGSCAEFAAFRLPSILVPLPSSADDHQRVNAREFVGMGAASLLEQNDLDQLPTVIDGWLTDAARREQARHNLGEWDCPNATADILKILLNGIA
jgi:UDP-N-acetylglucosamine--N-acetylmuramyl-(pentapeptide) pyrophosphoryl-undecaprenol N-acetylglucosamine transferase